MNIKTMIPLMMYILVMLYIAFRTNELKYSGKSSFLEEYFIGSRGMGGFVLAMTLIATYTSASSFIGGPGVAYQKGLGWVFLASIQVPTLLLTLGLLGKRLAIVSRRINAITLTDYLKRRYDSNLIVILSSIAILVFFSASMTAQFVGGARLFETVAGLSYFKGLLIFGVIVIIYTSLGGFRAVALTDSIQGIVMIISMIVLFIALSKAGGGFENIMRTVGEQDPNYLTPTAGGTIAKPFMLSFWLLVGIGIMGVPQTTIRCLGFRDSKGLHRAIIVGTLVLGALMIGLHLIGVMGIAILPGLDSPDKVIPALGLKVLPPTMAGIFIGGPLAATMSSVDSILILASAAIVKDLFMNFSTKKFNEEKIKKITFFTTLTMGIVVFIVAMKPPKLLVWINLFATGGLESAFLWPIVGGLYWKKANKLGALSSMIVGLLVFFTFSIAKVGFFGLHPIVPTAIFSLLAFIVGSLFGKELPKKELDLFFEF